MVSDYNNVYTPRLVLEPLDNYFTEIHAMKLARELVEIFNEDKPIKTWENYEDELMVYHAKHEGTGSFLFLSTKDFDFQIGYLPHVADKDNIIAEKQDKINKLIESNKLFQVVML